MIRTARQLKALVRNQSGGDSSKANTLMRNYVMERFLERVSLSKYKDKLILKGGMLVSHLVGLDNRATIDIDTTVKNYNLTENDAEVMVKEIAAIEIEDGMSFHIKSVEHIMDEAEYPGIRIKMESRLENTRIPLKLDLSTGDVISPREVEFDYKLMFEERTIRILAYNIETVLAEKLETIISRDIANTRLRDFYDVTILQIEKDNEIADDKLKQAFMATAQKRRSVNVMKEGRKVLERIEAEKGLIVQWTSYQAKFDYARNYDWKMVMEAVNRLYSRAMDK